MRNFELEQQNSSANHVNQSERQVSGQPTPVGEWEERRGRRVTAARSALVEDFGAKANSDCDGNGNDDGDGDGGCNGNKVQRGAASAAILKAKAELGETESERA